MNKPHRTEYLLLLTFLVLAILVRLPFFTGPLREPSWRPSTTAYMAYRMAQESPPDILHPKVVYRGGRDVRVSEFPLYPFLVALAYKILDTRECLPVARGITFLFFLGTAYYLFRSAKLLFSSRVAWYALVVFMILPIGIFYSRSVHYDVTLLFFSQAFFYYGLRFCRSRGWGDFLLATLMATVAFLMKAPYCYFYGFPLLAVWLYDRENRSLKRLVLLGSLCVLPLAGAVWFNIHRVQVEGSAPESLLLEQKWTPNSQASWFFGSLSQRFEKARWEQVIKRSFFSVATPFGVMAIALVGFIPFKKEWKRGWWAVGALCLGVASYVLLIFPMIGSMHDYYSLPLMAPAALLIALFMEWLCFSSGDGRFGGKQAMRLLVVLCLLSAGSAYGIKYGPNLIMRPYFQIDWLKVKGAAILREHTREDDLILVVAQGRHAGETDPTYLSPAHRRGWMIDADKLDERKLEIFRVDGHADYCALYLSPQYSPDRDLPSPLKLFPRQTFPVLHPDGSLLGHLVLFDLHAPDEAPSAEQSR